MAEVAQDGRDDRCFAIIYQIAETVMDIAGPLFWLVPILAFMVDPLGVDVSRLN